MMVALQLMQGLDKIGVPYRFNDFRYIRKHPEEIACIIGKPHILEKFKWKNPIIFGAGIFSHPIDCPDLLKLYPGIKKIVVPGKWMKRAFDPFFGEDMVVSWPVGINTELWSPSIKAAKLNTDFLIYDKVRWLHDEFEKSLIGPIKTKLSSKGLSFETIRYGQYDHSELKDKLSRCKAVLFLCEHETQGLAYQQILSTGTPILAWDRSGFWQDPSYFPHKVKFGPVSSVPYWNDECGIKFENIELFEIALDTFIKKNKANYFAPRSFILNNLTLEICARKYLDIFNSVNT